MKNHFQRGQAVVEYLLGLAGVVVVAISATRLFFDVLEGQWDMLAFWLILPNP